MTTTIKKIEIYPINIPQKEPFRIALDTIYDAENILIRITTDNGLTGWGECSPFQSIHGETQSTCLTVGKSLARLLIGKSPLALEANLAAIDRFLPGNYCIKSAFDMALYDLSAQMAGLPLYAFLGGENQGTLRTDMTVGIDDPEKMAAKALGFAEAGFYAIKIKLGTTFAADVERIRQIRQALGPDIPLRIDANQGWNLPTAIRTLQALADYNIEYCEEPIPRRHFADLPRLRSESTIPIMADESLFDHYDAARLARIGAADFFNIKLGKSGGIYHALKIAAIAEAYGIPCQVGCFSESRLAITALAHLVMARRIIEHCDMDSPLMLQADPVTGGIQYGPAGTIKLGDAPGIGAAISPDFLTTANEPTIIS